MAAQAAHFHGNQPIPIIDLSRYRSGSVDERTQLAREVDEACRSIGFLVVSGHGIDPALIAAVDEVTRRFFDLPQEAKLRCQPASADIYRGYLAIESSALAYTLGDRSAAPDYREGFTTNRHRIDPTDPYYTSARGRAIFHPNVYPAELPQMQPLLERYYDEMSALASDLMRLFALALDLDEHYFDRYVDKHMTNLYLSNYPEQEVAPREGQLRAGAHTDYGSLTILRTEDRPGGLEVRVADGSWVPVPIIPDTFIINLGDLMAQWTNDRWVSTLHRVVNPPRSSTSGSRRQSIVFFHQPNYDAEIRCLPSCVGDGAHYDSTTSGDHLLAKMQQMTAV